VILITLILSFFTLVFGELVPKRIAMKQSEKVALNISGLITVISKLFAPIVWLLSASTNGILRLLGIDPNEAEEQVGWWTPAASTAASTMRKRSSSRTSLSLTT
jgi:putative hemolysin